MAVLSIRTIRRQTAEYPRLLDEIDDPPARIFTSGKRLEPAPFVAVVGTRKPTSYGVEMAKLIAADLTAAGCVVVSGMASGIDAAAHIGALSVGTTVAVLGSGIDICYPWRNRKLYDEISGRGTFVSEFPQGTPPLPHHFPQRNRIIAGMSLGVVIVEGRLGGGAMITARLAAELNREVFAVPGCAHSPESEGPHTLLREGARLCTGAADVLEELGLLPMIPSEGPPPEMSPDETRVAKVLEGVPVVLDSLAQAAGLPATSTAAVLSKLELKGVALRFPGGRFALSPQFARVRST